MSKTSRNTVWILFSSGLFALVVSTPVLLVEGFLSIWGEANDYPAWTLCAFVIALCTGLAYHSIVWFNSRKD